VSGNDEEIEFDQPVHDLGINLKLFKQFPKYKIIILISSGNAKPYWFFLELGRRLGDQGFPLESKLEL